MLRAAVWSCFVFSPESRGALVMMLPSDLIDTYFAW